MARTRTPDEHAESLLNALDPLPYPQRMRELALRVRETVPLRPVLEVLETRGPYERGIAVVAASIGRDAEWIADRIADPDAFVRGHALRVAESLHVPDSAYEAALDDAPEAVRRELLRAIVVGRRTALADGLVDGVRRDWGDAEAARLLPGCTADTVVGLLPGLFHAVTGWKTLAKRHPGILLDVAEQELAALPEAVRATWWGRYAEGVAATVGAEPLRVLGLLERFGPATLPYELRACFGAFAKADPSRLLRLLLTPTGYAARRGRALEPAVLRRLARSGAPELAAYGRALAERGDLAPLVKALPPARRHAFYRAAQEGRGAGHGTVDTVILDVLPRSRVAEEARRMAAAARERGAQQNSLLLAESFLPVAEVRERLVEATRRPAAEDRTAAWPLLIRNAARLGDGAAVTSVLEEMGRLRNEHDPVRSAALHALSGVRPALFTEDAEPHLDRIAADAVEARDSSPVTRQHLSALALSVLREHAAGGRRELVNWALRTLVRISGNTGGADLGRLDARLRRGQEHQVYEALRPWIEAGAEKADYSLAFALARAVGRRAAGMPELQELLWQAIRYGDDATARTAVGLWLEPPATRDERVARVLALEPSVGALWPVRQIITWRRTDLLDVLLAEAPPYGRFLTKGTPWTVPVGCAVRRWVPRQQRAVARQLKEQAEAAGLPLNQRAAAVAWGALIPGTGAGLVRRWTDSPDVVLAEAALAALARTDRPADALPELLAHAGGERARVAVYAATQASRYAAPSLLAEQLRAVLFASRAKVTSRKEAARLAAVRLPMPRAAALLTEAYAAPGAHVDVRAACVAFAGGLLAEEPVWGLLRDAAGAEPVLRTAVLRVTPLDLPEPHRERYARLVRDVSSTDDPETASPAFVELARWAPWSPEAPKVLADAVTDLTRRTSWRAAADGLVTAAAGSPRGGRGLEQALKSLAEKEIAASDAIGDADAGDAGGRADADERRDRPARQRVDYLVTRLAQQARTAPGPIRPAALAAAELLAEYDSFVPQSAAITAFHLDLDAEPERLERLASLTEGRPALAARTARELGERLGRQAHEGDPGTLLDAARRLAAHGGYGEGLLAAAVTEAIGTRTGWAAPWRELLRSLRRHPVADVRDAALDQVTAYE
ncbi:MULTISPECIES: hypothetical protein [Streptomyces]|uniref:HEAT repeat domain-containing protein n=1 Tax=Streptomyces dengpaensis TaxID=2049881 RepID=A0ABN5I0Y2_9ACTN|nr:MULTISPECIES: hypothetical protein [Streptomyces]AVH55262.1 hypothetical protein C4B68_05045 [Streptomyces dengpaensis]PIB07370.1 hypothetical protein B1C81_19785 [Streptomyces sp. HG99]